MLKIRKITEKIILILYIFCAIFAPPFFSFNLLYILSLISSIYLLLKNKKLFTKKYRVNKNILAIIFLFFYLGMVLVVSLIFGNRDLLINKIVVIYQWYVLIPMQIITCFGIQKYAQRNRINNIQLLNFCLYAGILQGIIVCFSFFVPEVREFFLNTMLKHGAKTRIYANQFMMSYRGYGFAATLLDTFGYGMGLISGILFLSRKKKYVIFKIIGCLLCLFGTALNARTGLLIFLVVIPSIILDWFFRKKINIKDIKKIIYITISFCILIFLSLKTNIKESITFSWIKGGFLSVFNFLFRIDASYQLGSMKNSLFNKGFWQFPDNLFNFLFGTGHSVYGTKDIIGVGSDSGYVNCIWIIGIIGTVILFYIILKFSCKKYTEWGQEYKIIVIFITLSFFIMFIKGNVVTYNSGTFVSLFIFLLDLKNNKLNIKRKKYEKRIS